jgi:D-arabinose 1-dehydrogenase-like Zn-dependent alcohol dehydrogenase
MRAVVVDGEEWNVTDVAIPEPARGEVRIEVAACGLCGGDLGVLDGIDGVDYPRIPGHEIAGFIDAVGPGVSDWSVGDRVAVGWHGGHCFDCDQCRHGKFTTCEHKQVTGMSHDGGLAEYTTARTEALVNVPEGIDTTDAAPLVCAGLTPYNALRNSTARPGDIVAVQGLGGVGHMGVQFATKMGYETVVLSRGTDKRDAAIELGADEYIDTTTTDPASALGERGGGDAILSTVPAAAAIESVVGGLAPDGELLLVGAPSEPVEISIPPMLDDRLTLRGWSAGHPGDAADTLALAAQQDIEPWTEQYSLDGIGEAVASMTSGSTRFRAVIQP